MALPRPFLYFFKLTTIIVLQKEKENIRVFFKNYKFKSIYDTVIVGKTQYVIIIWTRCRGPERNYYFIFRSILIPCNAQITLFTLKMKLNNVTE